MRTSLPRLLLALVAGVALAAPAVPADATPVTDAPVPIAPTTTLTASGHGWGHGHGMSQYGAQGAAREGLTYDAILGFYYPGTSLSSLTGKIRVLITADTDDNTTVRATPGLRLTDIGRGKTWVLPTSKNPRAWRLRVRDGHTQVLYRTATWHRYSPGGHAVLAGDGQFSSSTSLVTLRLPSGDRIYRGALRLANRDTVNVVGIDRYLRGVVPSEMPSSWKPAALQAQAVAARTYAARARADNASRYYHLCDTTACQVYKGYGAEVDTTNAAVDATAGKILLYNGTPAFTQFSSSSGGWTSDGGQPYLPYQQDVYDKPVDPNTHLGDPYFDWSKALDMNVLRAAFPGTLTSIQITRDAPYASGGRVTSVVLKGSGATPVTLSGSTFRSMFGLKSTYFTVTTP